MSAAQCTAAVISGCSAKMRSRQRAVRNVPAVEGPVLGELRAPRDEVVEDDRCHAGIQAGRRHRAADEAGAAGNEDLHGALMDMRQPYVTAGSIGPCANRPEGLASRTKSI